MLNKIIEAANQTRNEIGYIKSKSPMYPDLSTETIGNTTYISSKVRIIRHGRYYIVPLISTTFLGTDDDYKQSLSDFHKRAYCIDKLFVIEYINSLLREGYLDPDQQSEEKRLEKFL